jgi:hypothetical protein
MPAMGSREQHVTQEVQPPRAELCGLLDFVTQKANENEILAKRCTVIIILGSATVPVLLLASTEWAPFVLGKLIPSIVSACAAAAAGFLQFRRPYAAWKLYRCYEGELRAELRRYDSGVKPYNHKSDRERVLAETVAWCDTHIDEERVGIVPRDADVFGATRLRDEMPWTVDTTQPTFASARSRQPS